MSAATAAADPAGIGGGAPSWRSDWSRTCRRRGWRHGAKSATWRCRRTRGGLDAAAAAVTVARGALAVLHLPPALLRRCLEEGSGPAPSGVLLRADLGADRALLALVVRDLMPTISRSRSSSSA